jgi:5-hydroxyisourate hydrolase
VSAISTHVLDLARGSPAAGVPVRLERLRAAGAVEPGVAAQPWPADERPEVVASGQTDQDGRARLAEGADVQAGVYRLVFDISGYHQDGEPPFFPEVAITFMVTDTARGYHVPLLLSPYGYSTYRGS